MLLKWEPIYSVNVKEIDEQHKKMFDIINRIYSLTEKSIKEDESLKVIEELIDYGNYHLDTEEKYFKKFDYPDTDSHIAQHDNYKKRVLEMKNKLEKSSDKEFYIELSNFLRDWWLGHIQNVDHKYSDFFNQKGLY
ncbi:MAG: bacteriohemerythrin [Candidatus Magasanikbacteria bacterium]|nr:bacteriohemerythrin [Candidatus Magasanikbacteria bacterium]